MGNFPHSLPAYLISFEKFHLLPFLSSNAVDQMQSVPHDESQCRKMSASGRSSVPDIELDQFQFTMSVLHPAVEATWTQCFRQQVPEETPFLASIYLLCVWLKIMSEERSFLFFFFAWGVFFFTFLPPPCHLVLKQQKRTAVLISLILFFPHTKVAFWHFLRIFWQLCCGSSRWIVEMSFIPRTSGPLSCNLAWWKAIRSHKK